MATWTLTFLPIQQVLLNGGEMNFNDLVKKLISLDPARFRDEKSIDNAIRTYPACLEFSSDNQKVIYNAKAIRYSVYGMERSIQFALHESVPNMEKWQLYPMKVRSNSPSCYLGIFWEEIPRDIMDREHNLPFDDDCDFREDGKDHCTAGCGVSDDILAQHGYF